MTFWYHPPQNRGEVSLASKQYFIWRTFSDSPFPQFKQIFHTASKSPQASHNLDLYFQVLLNILKLVISHQTSYTTICINNCIQWGQVPGLQVLPHQKLIITKHFLWVNTRSCLNTRWLIHGYYYPLWNLTRCNLKILHTEWPSLDCWPSQEDPEVLLIPAQSVGSSRDHNDIIKDPGPCLQSPAHRVGFLLSLVPLVGLIAISNACCFVHIQQEREPFPEMLSQG